MLRTKWLAATAMIPGTAMLLPNISLKRTNQSLRD
jgi:hypothetical protein